MKKLLILLLALVLCLTALTSCEKVLGIFFNPVEPEPQPEVEYNVNSAAAYLEGVYGGEANVIQPADYKVTTKAPYAGVAYDVTWTVDNDKIKIETIEGDANNLLINVPEKSPEEITYKLTATVTAPNGDKTTVSFDRKVLQYNVTSFEDYINGEKGETVTIEGIVVAMNSKSLGNKRNHIFLADAEGKGGYYSYQMDQDPIADLGIEVGMTVSVTGPLSPYSGMQEISGGTATIVDKTIKTVAPMDITALVESGASLKNYAGLVVTIKNVDVVGGQSLADPNHQYLYFEKGNTVSYVRTYQTDLIHTIVGVEGVKERIEADHLAHQDYTANVTGVLVLYNGNPYLIPMSETPFEWLEYVPKTPEYKVNKEFNNLTFDSSFNSDTVVDLQVKGKNYSEVTITWESNNANAVVADGKLTVTVPETDTTIKLTATITCEGQTKTKEFEVTLSRKPISIADALELADGANVYVAGEVVEINTAWSDQYGNITVTISDGENTLYVYRMKTNVVVGDVIEIRGVMGSYNGKKQIAQGSEAVITDHAPVEATAAEAKALEDGRRVIVTGTVTEINTAWSEQYKNITVTITDDNGDTLYIYRLATNVKVGDYIKITGRVGSYNGSKQIAQGATAELTEKGEEPEGPQVVTIPEANELADGTEVIISGEVIEIKEAWSSYNNMSVYISDGTNTFYVFRMNTQVKLGDVIKVTGKIGSYNGSKQIAQGATAEVTDPAPVEVTIPEANELADGRRVIITGEVVEIKEAWSSYNNMSVYISDGTNTFYVFRMKTQVKLGDVITVTGKIGSYNGSKQIAQGATAEVTETVHVNKLVVGETNKIVVDGETLNGYGLPVAWVEFVVTEKAVYTFVANNSALALIYDAADNAANNLCGFTGSATLEAGTYYICIGSGAVGEFNVAVTKTAAPVTVTVYYKNVDNWAQVSAWIWTSSENFTGGNWPGMAATAVEGADGWYSYTFTTTSSLDGLKLIFNNNNNDSQTADLTYDPEKLYWCNGTAYATMDEADAAQLLNVWYLRGSMTGDTWPALPEYQLQRAEDGTASIVLELAAGGPFKIATANWNPQFNSASEGVVDGVNFAAEGENIKVLTAGTYKFVVSADDSTLTITPVVEEKPVQTTASKTIAELITSEGWTDSTTKQEFKLDDNVTVKVNGGTNSGKAYSGDHIRIYATDSPAGTLTISVPEGYELVSVKVSTKTGTYAFLYVDGTTTDICNTSVEVSGTSVVLNSVKNGSNGKQVRVTAIEVVYKVVAE